MQQVYKTCLSHKTTQAVSTYHWEGKTTGAGGHW